MRVLDRIKAFFKRLKPEAKIKAAEAPEKRAKNS